MQKGQQQQQEISYKIFLLPAKEVRRFNQSTDPSLEELLELAKQLFGAERLAEQNRSVVQYKDQQGDTITVSSEAEWKEFLRLQGGSQRNLRKLYLISEALHQPFCNKLALHRNCALHRDRSTLTSTSSHCPPPPPPPPAAQKDSAEKRSSSSSSNKQSLFQEGNVVHLISKRSGGSLRITKEGVVEGCGRKGKRATFIVHRAFDNTNSNKNNNDNDNEDLLVKLQNVGDKKHWLRMRKDGSLDGLGRGGPLTEFQVLSLSKQQQQPVNNDSDNNNNHHHQSGKQEIVCLRSARNQSNCVAVNKKGQPLKLSSSSPSSFDFGQEAQFVVFQASSDISKVQRKQQRREEKRKAKQEEKLALLLVLQQNEQQQQQQQALVEGKQVQLKSKSSGGMVRIKKDGRVDGLGKQGGRRASFFVRNGGQPGTIRLQNVADEKRWLRLSKDGLRFDGKGNGGALTDFKVIVHSSCTSLSSLSPPSSAAVHCVSLRSFGRLGHGAGITSDGQTKKPLCTGFGRNGRFLVSEVSEKLQLQNKPNTKKTLC